MKWSEEAEIFFTNVIGDPALSEFKLVFTIVRACCEKEAKRRLINGSSWRWEVMVQDVVVVIGYAGVSMTPEEIASWSR